MGILLPGESRKNKLLATEDLSMWTITKTSLDSMQQLLGSDINHPQVITFFWVGFQPYPIMVGLWPLHLPGAPAQQKWLWLELHPRDQGGHRYKIYRYYGKIDLDKEIT